eukprot:14063499-Ditylum_brightwellii.AAC.1
MKLMLTNSKHTSDNVSNQQGKHVNNVKKEDDSKEDITEEDNEEDVEDSDNEEATHINKDHYDYDSDHNVFGSRHMPVFLKLRRHMEKVQTLRQKK